MLTTKSLSCITLDFRCCRLVDTGTRLRKFELAVDLFSYPKADFIPGGGVFVPKDLPKHVMENGVVDEVHWYYDETGAAAYLALVESTKYDLASKGTDALDHFKENILIDVSHYINIPNGA